MSRGRDRGRNHVHHSYIIYFNIYVCKCILFVFILVYFMFRRIGLCKYTNS